MSQPNRRRLAGVVALLVMLAAAPLVRAWNADGHMVVAAIAWEDLDDAARGKVTAILKQHPRYEEDLIASRPKTVPDVDRFAFLRAAVWPDTVRGEKHPLRKSEHHGTWHYIDYPLELDGVKGKPFVEQWAPGSEPDNVLQAIAFCDDGLGKAATSADRRAVELCWLVHLIGDIHQPLHATEMFSARLPKGDQGGNLVIVRPGKGGPLPLHTLWDRAIGDSGRASTCIKRATEMLEDPKLSRAALADMLKVTAEKQWAGESHQLARDITYQGGKLAYITDEENRQHVMAPPLPDGYEARMLEISRQRIALAGYRLADRIKQLLK